MTRYLNSFGELALEFISMTTRTSVALGDGLDQVMAHIEASARRKVGRYQDAVGPFPAWPELSDAYEAEKVAAGYPDEAPLLRTGQMVASFGHETDRMALEGVAGAKDETMVFHEFGTKDMPARPVWGPALFEDKALIQRLVGAAATAGMIGADQVHELLGYDHRTSD